MTSKKEVSNRKGKKTGIVPSKRENVANARYGEH